MRASSERERSPSPPCARHQAPSLSESASAYTPQVISLTAQRFGVNLVITLLPTNRPLRPSSPSPALDPCRPSFAPLPRRALQVGSPFVISVGGCKDFDMGAVFDTSSTLAGDTTAQRAAFQASYAASRKCSFASPNGFGSAYKFAK